MKHTMKPAFSVSSLLMQHLLLIICINVSTSTNEVKLCVVKASTDLSSLTVHCFNQSANHSVICSKINMSEYQELKSDDLMSAAEINVQDCVLKPRMFGSLKLFLLVYFISMPNTKNTILRNNSFHGLCLVKKVALNSNSIEIIEQSAFSCLSNVLNMELAYNRIALLPDNIFEEMTSLSELYLQFNNIHTLYAGTFRNLLYLDLLALNDNEISQLPDELFHNVRNIFNLTLTNNKIETLNETVFSQLAELKFLNIAGNELKTISNVFLENKNLELLSVDYNKALTVDKDSLRGLYNLKRLQLNYCNITFLPNELFMDTRTLEYLLVSKNSLREVNGNTFALLKYLQVLDLSYNDITELVDQPFKDNSILKLDLGSNKLSEIKKSSLQGLNFVTHFGLYSNRITRIEENAFENMPNLTFFLMQDNYVPSLLGSNPLGGGDKLWYVNISNNELTDISNIKWKQFPNLEYFYAENNKIKELIIPHSLKRGAHLNLEGNQITKLHFKMPKTENDSHFDTIIFIYLKGNPIECDCHSYELYTYLNDVNYLENDILPKIVFQDGVTCKQPKHVSNKSIEELEPRDFVCNIPEMCPERCSCIHIAHGNIQVVNCSYQEYDSLPLIAPYNTTILDMSHNNLTSLVGLHEIIWGNLTEIYAEYNEIASDAFYIPKNAKILSLHHNKMKKIPNAMEEIFDLNTDLKMTISDNLWPCDCQILIFKKNVNMLTDSKNLHCIFANNSRSYTSIMEMKDSDICPILEYIQYVVSSVLLVLLISALVFYYKHKLYVLSFMYSHFNTCYVLFFCNKNMDDEKLYDCFVSYSSSDREVTLKILEELENKPPYFKFCIHERNWLPGHFITNNITESVQNSRKTLIIISKTFLKSSWFYLEFQAAYNKTLQDKTDRLVIILKGELPSQKELDADVLHVLSSKTYLQWGERWFWEKLRYAIYSKNDIPEKKSSFCFKIPSFLFRKKTTPNQTETELI